MGCQPPSPAPLHGSPDDREKLVIGALTINLQLVRHSPGEPPTTRRKRGFALVFYRFASASLALLLTAPALAQPVIAVDSTAYVERDGPTNARALAPARELAPGDRVVYLVRWVRKGGDGMFTVTNPLPRTVAFQASADGDEQVSVDGGRSWGKLGTLRIGDRLATPEDVTHVRWRIASPQASGQIAYSAIVR